MINLTSAREMTTAFILLSPTKTKKQGKVHKTFPKAGPVFLANQKTYGGTERERNGVWFNEDTAEITTWYRPDITGECRVKRESDGAIFEIVSVPENIEGRNKIMKFKIKRIAGVV